MLTNDGEFVYKVTHPKHEIDKTYIAKIKGNISEKSLEQLRNGVKIEDYITHSAKVRKIQYDEKTDKSEVEVIIHEGKNRQVRKMFEQVGYEVLKLHRTNIGTISVKNMKLGEWKHLKKEEISELLDN